MSRSPRHFTVDVPATTANLGPGFDCVGLALDLVNSVRVTVQEGTSSEIDINGIGAAELSRGPDNLVLVAMRHLYAKHGSEMPAVRLAQTNRIPMCSGLGSSAAAEIAGLVAANAMLGQPYSDHELLKIGLELEDHPDNIVPALVGGLCVAIAQHRPDGWQLDHVRLDPPNGLTAAVVTPALRIETVESRRRLPASYHRADAVHNTARAALLIAALAAQDWEALATALDDRFHQPYRLPHIVGAEAALAAALEAGAIGAVLSGSGPTLLALSAGDASAPAEAMRAAWANEGVEATARVLGLRGSGAVIVDHAT